MALTGGEAIREIRRLIARELFANQVSRKETVNKYLSSFFTANKAVPRKENELLRAIRNFNLTDIKKEWPEVNSQDKGGLEILVSTLRDRIKDSETVAHQKKTQATFILAFFRPFETKYSERWFSDRADINAEETSARIEALLERRIVDADSLLRWLDDLELLFAELVVRKPDSADKFENPYGTIQSKSARIYLAAWRDFKKKYDLIFRLCQGEESESPDLLLSTSEQRKVSKFGEEFLPRQISTREKLANRQDPKFKLSTDSEVGQFETLTKETLRVAPTPTKPRQRLEVIVELESSLDSSARASKSWKSEREFVSGLDTWLNSLPTLWGRLADRLTAKVTIQTSSSKSEVSIPALTSESAAGRILIAATTLIES